MRSLRNNTARFARASALLAALASPRAEAAEPEPETPETNRKEPPKGKTMYGLGIASVTFGVLNIGYGIPLAYVCPADACFPGWIPIGFGVAFIAVGATAIHIGKQRRASHEVWREATGLAARERQERLRKGPEPRTGAGLIAGGSSLIVAGISGLSWGLGQEGSWDSKAHEWLRYPPQAKVALSLGAATLVGGAVVLGFGVTRARKHHRWDRGNLTAELAPTPMWFPGGAGFGVVGRF